MRALSSTPRLAASQRTRRVSSAAMIVALASSAASRGEASSARPIGTAASVSTPACSWSRSAMAAFSTTLVRLAGPSRHS